MYRPKHFQMPDDEIAAFIASYPLATLVSIVNSYDTIDSEVNFAPLIFNAEKNILEGHLANNNPHLEAMKDVTLIKAIFNGVDAYISPNWYLDKTQVPTWNFESVVVEGHVQLIESVQDKRALLTRASEFHETSISSDWNISKVPMAKLDAMLNAITGFSISIKSWQGKSKLSQNKSTEELNALINGLRSQKGSRSISVAKKMQLKKTG